MDLARLIVRMAPRAGLRPERVEVLLDEQAERITSRRHALGVMQAGRIYLAPGGFRVNTTEGRYLLGHELAHLAQRELPAASESEVARERAETEAELIGAALALGRDFEHPRVAVPAWAAVHAGNPAEALRDTVKRSRQAEIEYIRKLVDKVIWVSDRAVEKALLTLVEMDFYTAAAVIGNLRSKPRYRLVDNIGSFHYGKYRREILACYLALEDNELARFDEDLLKDIDLYGLNDDEHLAVLHVLKGLREPARVKLLNGKNGYAIRTIRAQEPRPLDSVADRQRKLTEDEQRLEKQQQEPAARLKGNPALQEDVKKIHDLMQKPSRDRALEALDYLTKYFVQPDDMRAIASDLESSGILDKMIERLPMRKVFKEYETKLEGQRISEYKPRRQTLLLLLSFRPAVKNLALAVELSTNGFLDFFGSVSHREALLALQLVKTLPPKTQAAFKGANKGKYWERVQANLKPEVRNSETNNTYGGGINQMDKAAIELPLLDNKLWELPFVEELDGRIRMAIAAGDHKWVFDISKTREAYKQKHLIGLVAKYKLYDPAAKPPRTQYQPEAPPGAPERSKAAAFFDIVYKLDALSIKFGGISLSDLDLEDVQDLFGGDIAGVKLKPRLQDLYSIPSLNSNHVTKLIWNFQARQLEMEVAYVSIASMRLPMAGMTLEAGSGRVEKLAVVAGYPSKKVDAYHMDAELGNVELNDITLVSADSMTAINNVRLIGLKLRTSSGSLDYESGAKSTEKGLLDIPFLSFIGGVIRVALNIGDAARTLQARNARISFDSLTLSGITTSSGQHIRKVTIRQFSTTTAQEIGGYEKALQTSLATFPARIQQAEERAKATTDPTSKAQMERTVARFKREQHDIVQKLEQIARDKAEIGVIKARKQKNGEYSDPDRQRLETLQRAGAVIDIGSVSIQGIRGKLSAEDMEMTSLHGHGSIAGYSETGEFRPVLAQGGNRGGLQLDFGDLTQKNLTIRKSVPTSEQVRRRIEQVKKRQGSRRLGATESGEMAELVKRFGQALRYEELSRRGVPNLQEEELKEFQQLHEDLTGKLASIGELKITDGNLSLDYSSGDLSSIGALLDFRKNLRRAAIGGGGLELTDVHVPEKGIATRRITSNGFSAAIERQGQDTSIELAADQVMVDGLALKRTEASLLKEAAKLRGGKARDFERSRLKEIDAALVDLTGRLSDLNEAKTAYIKAAGKPEEAAEKDRFERTLKLLDEWRTGLVAKNLVGQNVTVTVSRLGDIFKEDWDLDEQLDSGVKVGVKYDQLDADNAAIPGLAAEHIHFGKTDADLDVKSDGVDINHIDIAGVDLDNLFYSGGGNFVWTQGRTSLTGISIKGKILYHADIGNRDPKNGVEQPPRESMVIHFSEMVVQNITAPQVHYQGLNKKGKLIAVDLNGGVLHLVKLSGFTVFIPDDGGKRMYAGSLNVGGIDNLDVSAAIQDGLHASATVNASNLSASMALDGGVKFHVGQLGAEGEVGQGLDNKAGFGLMMLNGDASIDANGNLQVDLPDVKEVRVTNVDWTAGGKSIFSKRPAVLTGIRLHAAIQFEKNEKDPDGESKLKSISITEFHIDQITGEYVRYQDGSRTVEIKKQSASDKEPPLEIRNVNVTGVEIAGGKITRGHFDMKDLAAKIFVTQGSDTEIAAKLSAKDLNVDIFENGRIVGSVRELSVSAKGTAGGVGFQGGIERAKIKFEMIGNDIHILDFGIDVISLKHLSLWSPEYFLFLPEGGGEVAIKALSLEAMIHRKPSNPNVPADERPPLDIDSIEIQSLVIPQIEAKGLHLSLSSLGVTLQVPREKGLTVSMVEIKKPEVGGKPFTIRPKIKPKAQQEPGKSKLGLDILGNIGIDEATINQLSAEVTGGITASTDLRAKPIKIGFLGAAGMQVSIPSLTASNIRAKLGIFKELKIVEGGSRFGKAGAEFKNVKLGGGTFSVEGGKIFGVVYEDTSAGILIDIAQATLDIDPKRTLTDSAGLVRTLANGDTTISHLKIDEAFFDLDLTKLMGGPSSPSSLVNKEFLDALEGHVRAVVRVLAQFGLGFTGDFPIDISIKKGIVEHEQVLNTAAGGLAYFTESDGKLVLRLNTAILLGVLHRLADPDLIEWNNLTKKELRDADRGKMKLSTLAKGKPSRYLQTKLDAYDPDPTIKDIDIRDVDVDLHTHKPMIIRLDNRVYPYSEGTITVNLTKLTAGGFIKTDLELGLKEATARVDNLVLGKQAMNAEMIAIRGVHQAFLKFDKLKPSRLKGFITEAEARNITLKQRKKE